MDSKKLNKYNVLSEILKVSYNNLKSKCTIGESTLKICNENDELLKSSLDKIYKSSSKSVVQPTIINPNNIVQNWIGNHIISPNDILRVEISIRIDECIVMMVETFQPFDDESEDHSIMKQQVDDLTYRWVSSIKPEVQIDGLNDKLYELVKESNLNIVDRINLYDDPDVYLQYDWLVIDDGKYKITSRVVKNDDQLEIDQWDEELSETNYDDEGNRIIRIGQVLFLEICVSLDPVKLSQTDSLTMYQKTGKYCNLKTKYGRLLLSSLNRQNTNQQYDLWHSKSSIQNLTETQIKMGIIECESKGIIRPIKSVETSSKVFRRIISVYVGEDRIHILSPNIDSIKTKVKKNLKFKRLLY